MDNQRFCLHRGNGTYPTGEDLPVIDHQSAKGKADAQRTNKGLKISHRGPTVAQLQKRWYHYTTESIKTP